MAWFDSNAMHHCRVVRHIWDTHRHYHVDAIQKLIGTRCERNFRVERSWTFQRVDDDAENGSSIERAESG